MLEVIPYNPENWTGIKLPNFRDLKRTINFLGKHGWRRLPPKIEDNVFLKNIEQAINYARRINSRLPSHFEEKIFKDVELTWKYVHDVLRERFEPAEEIISTKPKMLVQYAMSVLKSRLPSHLEQKLIGDPYACFEYAYRIVQARLPEDLHNYMLAANFGSFEGKYFYSGTSRLVDEAVYCPKQSSPEEYFSFIKHERLSLARKIKNYSESYGMNDENSIRSLLYELENGK